MPITSGTKKKDVQVASPEQLQQERDVLAARKKGLTYREIADEVGLSGPGQASKIFHRAISRYTQDIGPEVRKLEELRLDELQQAIWDMAIAGDLKAVETVLRIMERRAKLCGLDHTDKMAAAQMKIEADKVRIMAIALGRALDALQMPESAKEKAATIMFREMKELTSGR